MPGIGPGNLPPRPPHRRPPVKPEDRTKLPKENHGIIGGDYGEDNQKLVPKPTPPVTDLPPLDPLFVFVMVQSMPQQHASAGLTDHHR